MLDTSAERRSFTTSDGATLSYLDAGQGRPFVMVPGWSQTALQWHAQIERFSRDHRVIAVDMRGHGESDKPDHGYRIHRLSQDLRELMLSRDLDDAVLMGHSMGCSVLWGLWDLYGGDRTGALILVDEPAYLLQSDFLTAEEQSQAGAIFPHDTAVAICNGLSDPAGAAAMTATLLDTMVTKDMPAEMRAAIDDQNFKFPRDIAARLIMNHVYQDWRDVLPRIDVPTLCIGAEASNVPADCMRWAASVIPGAELEVFGADEGGSHFMFMENAEKFNARVAAFVHA
ncbi:alpha/beta hydrolase [Rhodobacteraceae bacterium CCMM004]|nr:alpha/beta hydrolase [Rhodobacteraceae bacterium CCMM004]